MSKARLALLFMGFICAFMPVFGQVQESSATSDSTVYMSLAAAQAYALKNSYQIQYADKDVESARKKEWEAISSYLPQINATLDYQNSIKQAPMVIPGSIFGQGTEEYIVTEPFGTRQTMAGTATLSQTLFDGSIIVGIQSSKIYKMIYDLAKEKSQYAIREAVIGSYWNALVAERNVELSLENLKNAQKNLSDNKASYEQGLIAEEDVEQLMLLESTLRVDYEKSLRTLKISLDMLKYTIGMPIVTNLEITDQIEEEIGGYMSLSVLSQGFDVTQNVDYKIAVNTARSNKQLMNLEKSRALPSINAFINYTGNTYFVGKGIFGGSLMGVSVTVPIFSSLGRTSRTAQARIEYNKSLIQQSETGQKLQLDFQTAKSNFLYAVEQYSTVRDNMDMAERILRKEQIKYNLGMSTSYRITELTTQLINAQTNYFAAVIQLVNSRASLEKLYSQM